MIIKKQTKLKFFNEIKKVVIQKVVGEMNMIKNIIFDIGNVILNFNINEVLQKFTSNEVEKEFILKNIINSPEWLGNALIDTGVIYQEKML